MGVTSVLAEVKVAKKISKCKNRLKTFLKRAF